jgi:hypothetical protein
MKVAAIRAAVRFEFASVYEVTRRAKPRIERSSALSS